MPKLGPGQGGGGGDNTPVPAGDYIAVIRSFKRKQGKTSGKDYLRCRWLICSGPCKGRSFFANASCDLSKQGSVQRWQIMIEACDVTEEFELGDSRDGTDREGDENIRRLFCNNPMKVRVKVERNGDFVNNDVEMIHYKRTWTEADIDEMNAWLTANENGQGEGGSGDEDEETGGGGGSGRQDDPPPGRFDDDYGPPAPRAGGTVPDDDEIPF